MRMADDRPAQRPRTLRRAGEVDSPIVKGPRETAEVTSTGSRKVSGFSMPTARHEAAFEAAIDEVAEASRHLLVTVTRTMA